MLLPLLLIPLLSTVFAKQYTLNHRRSISGADFARFGTIDIPENDVDSNGVIRIEQTTAESEQGGDGWYQVQLTGEGLGAGVISSTKAVSLNSTDKADEQCYLNSGPVTLVIHKSHPQGISSIDLTPHSSTPRDGSCPTTRSTSDVAIMREVIVKSPHLVYGYVHFHTILRPRGSRQ